MTTELGEPDQGGRRRPVVVAGSEEIIACGPGPHRLRFPPQSARLVHPLRDRTGRVGPGAGRAGIQAFPLQTANAKIFAGGDMVRGSDLVVTAIWQGRQAARGILAHLGLD